MTTRNKHPERRPVDQVEGVIRIDNLDDQALLITPSSPESLRPLVQTIVRTAQRKLREQVEATLDEKASAA